MSITMTDAFCGAGGSSAGAVMVPGVEVVTALDCWDLANVMCGNRREQVKLAGNAVTPPSARDLVWAAVDVLDAA